VIILLLDDVGFGQLSRRFPDTIGLGSHSLTAMGFPGYNAMVPPSFKTVANYLAEAGYLNYALGRYDHTPLYEVSQVGPFERWPSGEGFPHSSCFMAADVNQFFPVMWDDHHPEPHRISTTSTRISPHLRGPDPARGRRPADAGGDRRHRPDAR
jgi:arylsulfatase A-like enzyme